MSRIYEDFKYTNDNIQKLKEIAHKGTQVNGWYEHPYEDGNIRGPWNRWINVSPDRNDDSKGNVADHVDDVKFIATAMNHFSHLLKEIESLNFYRDVYLKMREAVEFYGDKDNYKPSEQYRPWNNYCEIREDLEESKSDHVLMKVFSGKRARRAIKEVDEILGET